MPAFVAKDKQNGALWSNDMEVVKMVYDFSVDAGAVGTYELYEAKEAMIIVESMVKVKTAVVSGGAATVEIGILSGDTDAILAASLQAALTAPQVIDGAAASKRLYVASGSKIALEVKVAALTAGKIEVELLMAKY